MRPEASDRTLIYVSSVSNVYIYSYPGESLVGTLTGFSNALGLCSDAKGNVWIADANHEKILEYAHGGTSPIGHVQDPYSDPVACAVDSRTGNLAVANNNGNVAVFTKAQGPPTFYSTNNLTGKPENVTYDNSGNLYISSDGNEHHVAWLPRGASSIIKMRLRPVAPNHHHGLQYHGQYLTYLTGNAIYQFALKGSRGKKKGAVKLNNIFEPEHYWIQGSEIFVTAPYTMYVFSYPEGGYYTSEIGFISQPYGVVVSIARK